MNELSPYEYDTRKQREARYEERVNRLDLQGGGHIHTTVDSFERFNQPRRNQELTRTETAFAELNTFNADEKHDKILIQALQLLMDTGKRPEPCETVSDFIDRLTTDNIK